MSQKITFASYNIRTSDVDEGTCSDELNSWKYRKTAVFDLIHRQNPCIFGVQEDSKEQLSDLTEAFGRDYSIVAFEGSIEEENREFNTIFISKVFEVGETGFRWISDTPQERSKLGGSICYRHLTFARVRIAEEVLLVVNVHLDHSEDYNFKHTEALCFMNIIKELMIGEESVILMGDFNMITDSNNAYKAIANDFLDVSKYFGVREPTHPNWLMWNIYKQIDYFWVSRGLSTRLDDFQIIKDKYVRKDGLRIEPSDHFLIRFNLQ